MCRSADRAVRLALDLLMECPDASARSILDRAMRDLRGTAPTFENIDPDTAPLWGDHLDPPAPFAELVRRALAPKLDPHAWSLLGSDAGTQAERRQAAEAWCAAIEQFGATYALWEDQRPPSVSLVAASRQR